MTYELLTKELDSTTDERVNELLTELLLTYPEKDGWKLGIRVEYHEVYEVFITPKHPNKWARHIYVELSKVPFIRNFLRDRGDLVSLKLARMEEIRATIESVTKELVNDPAAFAEALKIQNIVELVIGQIVIPKEMSSRRVSLNRIKRYAEGELCRNRLLHVDKDYVLLSGYMCWLAAIENKQPTVRCLII